MPDDNKTTDTNPTPTQDVSGVSQTIPPMEPSISTPIPPPVSPTDQGQTIDTPPPAANSTVPPPPPIIEEQKKGEADIPPIVTTGGKPKGKVSKKVIATILGILFLVGGVSAGVILVQQQQEIREQARLPEPCKICSGEICIETGISFCLPDLNECELSVDCATSTPTSTPPTSTPTPTPDPEDPLCSLIDPEYCVGNNPSNDCWCGDASGPSNEPYWCCKLNGNPGKRVSGTTSCRCPDPYNWGPREEYGYFWCFNTLGKCTGEVVPCTGYLPGADFCDTSVSCGTEPDPRCYGTTPTPTPTDETYASCLEIQAFDTEWNPIADLSSLVAGDVIRFTVSGDTNSGSFDKARFRINSPTWRTVVVAKKPGTSNFYDEYTIPEGVTSFTINAQIHHTNLDIDWF
ncbi:hypothetical protein KAT60_00665 [Candidatus Woesebacteria bacterium]|nr:hypothetical protein [Candidatus Woesebacteria bacterium]